MDIYFIICHPFRGYGESFVWSAYHNYDNAMKELDKLVKKYNLDKNNLVAYNFNTPTIQNCYEKFEIDDCFFED